MKKLSSIKISVNQTKISRPNSFPGCTDVLTNATRFSWRKNGNRAVLRCCQCHPLFTGMAFQLQCRCLSIFFTIFVLLLDVVLTYFVHLQSINGGFPAWEPQKAYGWLEVSKCLFREKNKRFKINVLIELKCHAPILGT